MTIKQLIIKIVKMNSMKLIIMLLCLKLTHTFLGDRIKQMKKKAKDAYMKKFKKDKTWHFLGHDLSEYPGINPKYRQLNQEKWDAYYECLKAQDLSDSLSMTPEAIIGFQSNSINPLEIIKLDSIEWKWAKPTNNQFEPIEYTENILLQPQDRSLSIYDLQLEQSGQYRCEIGEAQSSPYILTVLQTDDDNLRKVHPESSPIPPYPLKITQIEDINLFIDTQWGPWTSCSKCNQIGRRYRLGYCIVKYNEIKDVNKQNSTIQIPQEDLELLKIFENGIPCQSHILPYSIRILEAVQNRSNEVMSGYCKVNCPDDVIFEVRDKDGNVIERVNNTAGIYSMIQGPPVPQPSVVRQIVFGVKDEKLIITCPGNLNSDIPVEWQIGTKKVIPELIKTATNGRIYVSITDKIHIKKAKISDTNIYSCWQSKELAGTVRLIVENRLKLTFNHHIMLFGMVVILLVFLYIFYKSLRTRKYV